MTYTLAYPQLGLVHSGRTGDAGIRAILSAIEIGYRHIDTAQSYDTEAASAKPSAVPGCAIRLLVTTKLADNNLSKAISCRASREPRDESVNRPGRPAAYSLAIPRIMRCRFDDYMLALAEARQRGWTRHIGVSNFPIALLDKAFALLARIRSPRIGQIHPYLQAPRLVNHCRSKGLALTAYQPLYKGAVNDDPLLKAIAETHGVTAAAVALAFLMAEGHAVIPASSSLENLRNNFASQDVNLTADEITRIRMLDRSARHINPAKSPRWDD